MTFGESFAIQYIIMTSTKLIWKVGVVIMKFFTARKRAVNYYYFRKPPTTNPRIAHG